MIYSSSQAPKATCKNYLQVQLSGISGQLYFGRALTTDIASNIVLPEEAYTQLADTINGFQSVFVAVLNKDDSANYQDWFLDISALLNLGLEKMKSV